MRQILSAVPRRINARRAAERINAQPRIVRDGGLPGQPVDGLRLEEGVFGKGFARLLHRERRAHVALRRDLNAERRENPFKFL